MPNPRESTYGYGENEIKCWNFDVPMMHKDFHEAEEMGLKYFMYVRVGPDYWDDYMMFIKPEDMEKAEEIRKTDWW